MSTIEIISLAVAFLASASKLLASTKPLWNLMPKPVALLLPSLVVMLPYLAEKLGMAHTTLDVVSAVIMSLALVLPGAAAHADSSK